MRQFKPLSIYLNYLIIFFLFLDKTLNRFDELSAVLVFSEQFWNLMRVFGLSAEIEWWNGRLWEVVKGEIKSFNGVFVWAKSNFNALIYRFLLLFH